MHDATIAGGRRLTTWNDLLGVVPGVFGVKTGHTSNAGWCQVAAVRGQGLTVYATILGSPSRAQRNTDLEALLRWGLSRYRVATVISPRRVYASAEAPFDRGPVRLVAAKPVKRAVRLGRRLREEVVAPTVVPLPVHARPALRRGADLRPAAPGRERPARGREVDRRTRSSLEGGLVREARRVDDRRVVPLTFTATPNPPCNSLLLGGRDARMTALAGPNRPCNSLLLGVGGAR